MAPKECFIRIVSVISNANTIFLPVLVQSRCTFEGWHQPTAEHYPAYRAGFALFLVSHAQHNDEMSCAAVLGHFKKHRANRNVEEMKDIHHHLFYNYLKRDVYPFQNIKKIY